MRAEARALATARTRMPASTLSDFAAGVWQAVKDDDVAGLMRLCMDPEHDTHTLDTPMGPDPQRTALHLAVSRGNSEAAVVLLASGADFNATDDAGASVFARVAYMADRRMMDVFRVYRPTVDHEPSPLHAAGQHAGTGAVNNIAEACQAGDAAVVALMILLGGKVDHPLANGDSAMHVAVSSHRADLVRELIRGGADLTVLDGETGLHFTGPRPKRSRARPGRSCRSFCRSTAT